MADRHVARHAPSQLVILGHPVAHSLSPVFQQAALDACGIPAQYGRMDVAPDALADVLDMLVAQGAAGNVTVPHKEAVARFARCTPLAARVGAVNTFWVEDGALVGHNTDVEGVQATLARLVPRGVSDRSCVVIGAGGSAAAVLLALSEAGASIRMVARTPARAVALAERLGVAVTIVDSVQEAVAGAALVVNATPQGLRNDSLPVPVEWMDPGTAVFDLVYAPGETAWVRSARASGHPATDGTAMLLAQGAAAFTCWFNRPAPVAVMERALQDALAGTR